MMTSCNRNEFYITCPSRGEPVTYIINSHKGAALMSFDVFELPVIWNAMTSQLSMAPRQTVACRYFGVRAKTKYISQRINFQMMAIYACNGTIIHFRLLTSLHSMRSNFHMWSSSCSSWIIQHWFHILQYHQNNIFFTNFQIVWIVTNYIYIYIYIFHLAVIHQFLMQGPRAYIVVSDRFVVDMRWIHLKANVCILIFVSVFNVRIIIQQHYHKKIFLHAFPLFDNAKWLNEINYIKQFKYLSIMIIGLAFIICITQQLNYNCCGRWQ